MLALADSLQLTPDEDLAQKPDAPAQLSAAAAAQPAPAPAASSSSNKGSSLDTPAAGLVATASALAAIEAPVTDASELVKSFMASFGSGSMLSAGQQQHNEPLAPAAGFDSPLAVMVGDDYVIDITASQEEHMSELLLEHEQQQEQEALAAAAADADAQHQQQVHAEQQVHADEHAFAAWAGEQLILEPQQLHQPDQHQEHEQHEQHDELQVPGNGSSAEAFAAALDAATPSFPMTLDFGPSFSAAYDTSVWDPTPAAEHPSASSSSSTGPVLYNNPDPNWQAAHARALQWASNQIEPEEEEDLEDEEVPWWLKDNLPAARKTPTPIGGSSALSSPPSSPTSGSRLRWSRARFTSPAHMLTAEQQQEGEEGEEGSEDGTGSSSRSLRRPTAAQTAFSASAVTLATATPATAAAAAAAAGASPLVQNLQQHAYKAAKAIGQSDQAAAIAATAIASRVAFGCDPEAAAASISSPRRRRRSGSNGSSAGDTGSIAGAMAAAIKTRQQVLAVTDLAAQLAAAGDMTGTTGAPDLGGSTTGVAGFDPRPESLVPTVTAGPFQLADDVLVLPSAQQIATAAGSNGSMVLGLPYGDAAAEEGEDSNSTGEDAEPSDAELMQLAALQQENLMLSELASLHTRVIGLHEQAMKLEKEAHIDMEFGMAGSSSASSSTTASLEDDAGEADEVGGVLGLALKTAERTNGSRRKHDAAAVKKLMEAVKLRMEAALLQKEASEKRRALNAMRSAAASASAATFYRHWQVPEAAQLQLQQEKHEQHDQQDENDDSKGDGDKSGDDGSSGSNGGGYGGGGGSSSLEAMPVSAAAGSSVATVSMAAVTAAAAVAPEVAAEPAAPAAAAAPWSTFEVQPVAALAFSPAGVAPVAPAEAAAAPAEPAAAPAATAAAAAPAADAIVLAPEPPLLQRVRPMSTASAVAGVMSNSDQGGSQIQGTAGAAAGAAQQYYSSSAMGAQSAAPLSMTALQSSSMPARAAAAVTGVPEAVQEDMQVRNNVIFKLFVMPIFGFCLCCP